jgi:hypothetical protein
MSLTSYRAAPPRGDGFGRLRLAQALCGGVVKRVWWGFRLEDLATTDSPAS